MIDPAYFWVPPRLGSYGDEAIDLAAEAGRELDPEQERAVDAMLSFGPGGNWAALESAIVEARQNGKTDGVLLPVVLFDLFLMRPDRIVWTAHRFRTARDSFDAICTCIETTSILSSRVKKISYSHGEEAIELHNGALLEFLARSQGGGRGLKGKRVVMDEALILSADSMGTLMPTLSTRSDAQISYGSSAGKETSTHLHNLKVRGRAGGDPSLVWVEFCAPHGWEDPPCALGKKCPHTVGTLDCALDNEEFWGKANHTLGKRITHDYVRAERRALPPREFGRERLGWHESLVGGTKPISDKQWTDLIDIKSSPVDPVAIGIEVNNDRSSSAISVVGRRDDGLLHLEVIKSAAGVAWVLGDMVTLKEKWNPCVFVIDDRSEAASLLPDLKELGFKVRDRDPEKEPEPDELIVTTWASDLARACGSLYDAVADTQTARHLNQPELNDSVKGAAWRPLGDSRAWSRKNALTNPAPLISVTLALHGLLTYGPPPTKQEFFGAWR
ncbi:hypothetical protein [Amycolatopsis lurida]|uniref:hypothetical protein n=1 Tax=Amycolatopsis lurida TaxID=31959 RepID=UPI00365CF667